MTVIRLWTAAAALAAFGGRGLGRTRQRDRIASSSDAVPPSPG